MTSSLYLAGEPWPGLPLLPAYHRLKLMSQVLPDHGSWRQQSMPLHMGPGSSTQVGMTPDSRAGLRGPDLAAQMACAFGGCKREVASARGVRIKA